ncbi:BolA family protein [Sapientia aquatica]|uniref:BolA family transcriptional regulator n=1 Tax=Sapientia aquatica TaxID=1549640 RepID=A0A4R5W6R5_9BURK|nr:BolA family protein [Sapientia aquatica]TDK68660.1 BolA family transcriptional regulator [Sapientia aquatica]
MSNLDRITRIKQRLAVLNPILCTVEDESALHAGHAGAASGAGHFRITISSEKFNGLKPIQRHRLVYDAVGDLMQTDIHALAINALAASE